MTPLQAAADRVRRVNERTTSNPYQAFLKQLYNVTDTAVALDALDYDRRMLADAYLALHPVATAMLDVLMEVETSAVYWGLPYGTIAKINKAVADGRNALSLEEQPSD